VEQKIKTHFLSVPSVLRVFGFATVIYYCCLPTASSRDLMSTTKLVEVNKGDTLSKTILKNYGVSYSDPIKYQKLQDAILRLNGIKDADKIPAGPLLLPIEGATLHEIGTATSAAGPSEYSSGLVQLTASPRTQQGDSFDPNLVIVQLNLDSLYIGTKDKAKLIKELDAFLPHELVNVRGGDSISTIIARTYHIGNSTPEAKDMLVKEILKLNNLSKAEQLQPGLCFVPPLPPRLQKRDSLFTQPAFLSFSDIQKIQNTPETSDPIKIAGSFGYSQPETCSDVEVPEPNTILRLKIPRQLLEHLGQFPTVEKIIQAIANQPVPITLASAAERSPSAAIMAIAAGGNPTPNPTLLTAGESSYLSEILKAATNHSTYLFIQDTGWPSAEEMTNCYRTLFYMMDMAWKNGLGVKQSPYPRTIPKFVHPSNPHCVKIAESLQELRQLDSNKRINVVFVPLINDQNETLLLTEMIEIHQLIAGTQNLTSNSFTAKEIASAKRNAEGIVATVIPSSWNGNQVKTDVSVISAPFELFTWYGFRTRINSFLNQSWTAPHRAYYANIPSPITCIIVAAAGNEGTKFNVFDDSIANGLPDFVERCLNHADTIGVLNIHRNLGLDPTSSNVGGRYVGNASVVGFDGNIDSSTTGTSFAAPRVGWMLCAAESLRHLNLSTEEWPQYLKALIQESRNPIGTADQFWLDPIKLVKNTLNNP